MSVGENGRSVLGKPKNHFGGFPGGSDDKASACKAGDPGLIPGWGRSPGEGNGNLLQYSYLENSMDWSRVDSSPWGHRVGQD